MKVVEGKLPEILAAYPEAASLKLSNSSCMGLVLSSSPAKQSRYRVIMLLNQRGKPVAWVWWFRTSGSGWVTRPDPKYHYGAWVYVAERYRKRGLGKQLIAMVKERATRHHKKLRVYPWDSRSDTFFDRLRTQMRLHYS